MTLTQPLTSTATLTLTPSLTLHLDPRATQPAALVADNWAMLSFQRLEVYPIARGSAMECAAILDVMRLQQTIKQQRYERGVDLLTSVVAMLTKMI
jgi:hypothetical protein